MNTAALTADTQPAESSLRDYWTLLKPGVMLLVVFTGAAGLWLAPVAMHPLQQAVVILSIAMGSGAGAAFNMWYDRDIDRLMLRTASRPVPAGRVAAEDALAMGGVLSAFSVMLLGLASNWQAAALLGFSIFFYAVVYTIWLKRHTSQNIVIGGAAGAFPPVIGWLAATGDTAALPWIMFLMVFLWTPPHFWALALYRNNDYRAANIPMLPVTAGIEATKRQIFFYTLLLAVCAMAPLVCGAGWLYGGASALLNLQFIRHAITVWRSEEEKPARAMFGFSILYLFLLFGALLLDAAVLGR